MCLFLLLPFSHMFLNVPLFCLFNFSLLLLPFYHIVRLPCFFGVSVSVFLLLLFLLFFSPIFPLFLFFLFFFKKKKFPRLFCLVSLLPLLCSPFFRPSPTRFPMFVFSMFPFTFFSFFQFFLFPFFVFLPCLTLSQCIYNFLPLVHGSTFSPLSLLFCFFLSFPPLLPFLPFLYCLQFLSFFSFSNFFIFSSSFFFQLFSTFSFFPCCFLFNLFP